MTDVGRHCTEACEAVVECTVCHRPKPPVGRDVAAACASDYCEWDCPGRSQPPHAGHLWPGELARARTEEP